MDENRFIDMAERLARIEEKIDLALDPERTCNAVLQLKTIWENIYGAVKFITVSGGIIGFVIMVAGFVKG
jgi:hypothetical protein